MSSEVLEDFLVAQVQKKELPSFARDFEVGGLTRRLFALGQLLFESGLGEVGRLFGQHTVPAPGHAFVLDERFVGQIF